MFIEDIKVENFRNYVNNEISFDPNVNVIVGKNGQGKTNLLESIYIFSMGKSFRTNKDTEMIRFGEDYFRVEGNFQKEEDSLSVSMSLSKNDKYFNINGIEKRKNADLLENVYTVIFSPEDLKIVKEDPDKRRRFIDRELFQLRPLYYKYLAKYKKVVKNRNTSLKEDVIDDGLLDVWDEYIIENGAKIMKERQHLIEKINEISGEINMKITEGKENLSVEYESHIEYSEDINEQEEIIREELKSRREKDKRRRTTTAGPHKDDIRLKVNDIDIRHFGSQGQQRTAALALKLAELSIIKKEKGEDAILLLDDVLSELDSDRQRYLIESFKKNQIFITAADFNSDVLDSLSAGRVLEVVDGDIYPHLS